jgi:hypothetical protein
MLKRKETLQSLEKKRLDNTCRFDKKKLDLSLSFILMLVLLSRVKEAQDSRE